MKRSTKSSFPVVLFAVIASISLQSGCSSAHKRAQTLMDGGNYDEAAAAYQQILREDPNDAEAQVGLRLAREHRINDMLIEVRMTRLAGNAQQATEKLLTIVKLEDDAKYVPRGAVAFTQEEEAGYAFPTTAGKIRGALEQRFPLKAEAIIRKYKPLFGTGATTAQFKALADATAEEGRKDCRDFQAKSAGKDVPYFEDFAKRFCNHWGEPVRAPASVSSAKLKNHYKELEPGGGVEGLPPEVVQQIQKDLGAALERTAWFDADAPGKLAVKLSGHYNRQASSAQIPQTHSYTVQVPYTAYESQLKFRLVPYTSYQTRCGYGGCTQYPVTMYNTEWYNEQVPVTKFRAEARTYDYTATKSEQTLTLLITATARIKDHDSSVTLTENLSQSCVSHNISMPDIGLQPAPYTLADPLAWVKQESAQMQQKFADRLGELWVNLYCKEPGGTRGIASTGDLVQKCLRQPNPKQPAFVDDWYQNSLGLTREQSDQLLQPSTLGTQLVTDNAVTPAPATHP